MIDRFGATTRRIITGLAASHAACPIIYDTNPALLTSHGISVPRTIADANRD